MTALSWLTITLFAALPFRFCELDLSNTDALFEAMSGITTTGSTVIIGLDTAPPGILVWRGLLHWLGGLGIIVICNVGPALGPIAGPAGTFQQFPDAAKWLLTVGMLLGRLELFTILILFSPSFWRG
jgi:Trk-type K+ transport system membrane component